MPAENTPLSVNLLDRDELTESPFGRIVTWATTYGRYIMILTEIIVLAAFVSRFSLDRKLTDLNESIAQKQVMIEANQPFEQEVKRVQDRIALAKSIMNDQMLPVSMLKLLKDIMPPDVYLTTLSIGNGTVKAEAIALTPDGFSTFTRNLQLIPEFADVSIGDIEKDMVNGIAFSFEAREKAKPKPVQKPKGTTDTETESLDVEDL